MRLWAINSVTLWLPKVTLALLPRVTQLSTGYPQSYPQILELSTGYPQGAMGPEGGWAVGYSEGSPLVLLESKNDPLWFPMELRLSSSKFA